MGESQQMSRTKKSRMKLSSKLSDGFDIQMRFNALRFLAHNLKQQNDKDGQHLNYHHLS
jgi:hypothetical protein